MGSVANFICFSAVQNFWKSVKIWQSYWEFKGGNFFETQYTFIYTCMYAVEKSAHDTDRHFRLRNLNCVGKVDTFLWRWFTTCRWNATFIIIIIINSPAVIILIIIIIVIIFFDIWQVIFTGILVSIIWLPVVIIFIITIIVVVFLVYEYKERLPT